VLAIPAMEQKIATLTLDACGGSFDRDLLLFLIDHHIPATIFATKRGIDANPMGISLIKAHADLFEIEDHGANHVPAVIGPGRRVYGILGEPDMAHLRQEVVEGAHAIESVSGTLPHWYRSATAEYDPAAIKAIMGLGYKIAGFSVNADVGASLRKDAIVARLKTVKTGDILIAHMNKPKSDTAEGLAEGLTWLIAHGFQFVNLDRVNVRTLPNGTHSI
jgi:peptidoglycan/xylan/chitin deacetylase (PgdA/CDA1 family)